VIGIIDSGYGGLSVVRELVLQQKEVPFIYLGDNARNPYGTKTKEELILYGKEMIDYLISHYPQINTIIIACNTLCALALPELYDLYRGIIFLPIIQYGTRSALLSFNKHVTVMATQATISSAAYERGIKALDTAIRVDTISAQSLVEMVETQAIDSQILQQLTDEIDPASDILILGCTHFPFLYDSLRAFVSENLTIIDPAISCVSHLELEPKPDWQKQSHYLTTGSTEAFAAFITGHHLPPLPIEAVDITNA